MSIGQEVRMDHHSLIDEQPVSPFAAMQLASASAEYTDCDCDCDDGNTDNY